VQCIVTAVAVTQALAAKIASRKIRQPVPIGMGNLSWQEAYSRKVGKVPGLAKRFF